MPGIVKRREGEELRSKTALGGAGRAVFLFFPDSLHFPIRSAYYPTPTALRLFPPLREAGLASPAGMGL